MSYKVDGLSRLALQFTGANDDFLQASFAKNHVFMHAIEVDGRLRIMIEVDEDTTSAQLRNVIPDAVLLRDKLMEFQGAWSGGGPNEFFEHLCHLQERGMTYNRIAEKLRSRVKEHLREAVAFDDELRKALPTLKTHGDYFMWAYGRDGIHNQYNPASLDHAKYILELVGLGEEEITAWINESIENIKAGKEPLARNPITKSMMRDAIRNWRNAKRHKSILATANKAPKEL